MLYFSVFFSYELYCSCFFFASVLSACYTQDDELCLATNKSDSPVSVHEVKASTMGKLSFSHVSLDYEQKPAEVAHS